MTKFAEMCQAVVQGREKWEKYREQCSNDMHTIVMGFVAYCEIPLDNITYLPLNQEPEEGRNYTWRGAMHYDADGFWHLGLCINLCHLKTVLVELCVMRNKEKLLVKTGRDGKQRELNITNPAECEEFYESIADVVKQHFTTRLENALDGQSLARIGFV